jgi:hypothetical protein
VSRCKWKLPATAKGKKPVVTLSAAYKDDGRNVRPWVFTVR